VKRRTIIAGTLMIALVVMMMGVGSWAVFNDTESVPGTVGAGTLDLDFGVGSAVGVEILDLKPSEPHYAGPFILHNAGGNTGVLDLHFKDVDDSEEGMSEPECEAEGGTWDPGTGTCSGALGIYDISNWIEVDYLILDAPATECPTSGGTVVGKLGDIESKVIDLGEEIGSSELVYVCLSFHLQRETGNEYQGDRSTFNVEFTLHQLLQSASATTIRLEDKTGDPDWDPILDNDLYGSVTYRVKGNGDLEMQIRAHGLEAGEVYQFTLNSQSDPTCTSDTADQLASGEEKYAGYDSGFWTGTIPLANVCTTDHNEGIYNFLYETADPSGNINTIAIINNAGVSDPPNGDDVSGGYPSLPRGVYTDVKFIVKKVTNYPPGDSWTPVLMEMLETLNFNLP
jgi:predicted ribosomally synthesized peptide with SipW-like signal peptide